MVEWGGGGGDLEALIADQGWLVVVHLLDLTSEGVLLSAQNPIS